MGSIVGLDDFSKALIEAGNNLLSPHSSTDELLTLLDEIESLLINVEQEQPISMQNALIPSKNGLVSVELLRHPDSDVRVSVVSCLTEIVRITAPEAPYSDDLMKEIFRLTIEAFEKLADMSSRAYKKAESVLDNVSKVRSCLVMLDLECDELILQMFRNFLKIIRSDHPRVVFSSMEMIMITIIDETEEVSTDLLDILLTSVKKENQNLSPMSWRLVEKVLSRCARKLKPYIVEALKSTETSLDMYSPVVSSICQSVSDTTKVNTEENEAGETMLARQVVRSDSLEDKLDFGHSRKEIYPKRRPGTRRINENDKVRNRKDSSLLKQVRSESTDGETELGITGKRGRKPNSLMNPEEGYDISWISGKRDSSSNKKLERKGSGGESSLGKVAAKKTSSNTSRALTGSLKRNRVKMDESDHDLDSFSSPRLKKLASCFRDEEEPNSESFEDDRKIGKSSKKTRSHNGLEKSQRTAKKKTIVEAKTLNSIGKRSSARSDTSVSQSSKSKKMVSQESEETRKSHPTRRRTSRKEVESDTNGFGEDLVGKKVNIWWPLDKTFYEGVIDSYNSSKKMHRVIYSDGDSEELNLNKERWELIESEDMEIDDLPESIPLSDLLQRHRVKKSKNVEPSSSSGVRKKDSGKKLKSEEEHEKAREGKNLKSLKELNDETERREEEEEVSRDTESNRTEEDDCIEKQEESENNDSDSENEPKWRETEEDEEGEEREEFDDKETSFTSLSEIEKDEDEEEEKES